MLLLGHIQKIENELEIIEKHNHLDKTGGDIWLAMNRVKEELTAMKLVVERKIALGKD
jgi:hypothetical protein